MRLSSLSLCAGAVLIACAGGSSAPRSVASERPDAAGVSAPPPRADGRLPALAKPQSYLLELTVDPRQKSFAGRARIQLDVVAATPVLVLHARDLNVKTAAVVQRRQKRWAAVNAREAAHSKQGAEELVLRFEQPLEAGPAELDIQYEAPFAEGLRGLYRVDDGGESYAFTQFEPNDARRAFPSFDEPGYKSRFSVELTVPEGMQALANTPLLDQKPQVGSGLTTFRFQPSQPLSSYLVAFAVGPFDVLEGEREPVPVRLFSVKGKAALGKLAPAAASQAIKLLADYFDEPYAFSKLDLLAVPDFGAGAMENAGLVTFREELLLLGDNPSAPAQRGLYGVMAHELAHQWFGNLVTMEWWDDLWLNEGFASWMGSKIVERARPDLGSLHERHASKAWVMGVDALASARKIRQPVSSTSQALEAFDGITYVKGMSVLAMVEAWVGEDKFQTGVRDYIKRHRFANARAVDLFSALDRASARDVSAVMASFVDKTGVPLIEMKLECTPASAATPARARLLLEQREYGLIGRQLTEQKSWHVPVCVRTDVDPKQPACVLMNSPKAQLDLGARCPKAWFPNAGDDGYYRFQIPEASLFSLAKSSLLSEDERVGLYGNAWGLVAAGLLDAGRYLDLVTLIGKSKSRVLWQTVNGALGEYRRALVGDKDAPAFEAYVQRLLGPLARELGWQPQPDEPHDRSLLRRNVLETLGLLGRHAATLQTARGLADQWLADRSAVHPDVAAVALALAARQGDRALFDRMLAAFRQAETPEVRLVALGGLAGFDAQPEVERLLKLTLDGGIKAQDLRYVFAPLFARPATRPLAHEFIKARFSELEKRLPSFVVGRTVWLIASLCDRAEVAAAERFFTPRVARMEGAEKHLKQAVEAGNLCASLREAQQPAASKWLEGKP